MTILRKILAGVEAEFNINLKTVQELKVAKVDEELYFKTRYGS